MSRSIRVSNEVWTALRVAAVRLECRVQGLADELITEGLTRGGDAARVGRMDGEGKFRQAAPREALGKKSAQVPPAAAEDEAPVVLCQCGHPRVTHTLAGAKCGMCPGTCKGWKAAETF